MTDPVEMICNLAGCSREDAKIVYSETNDVVEAVDRLLIRTTSAADKYIQGKKRTYEVTEEEKIIRPYREVLKDMDEKMSTSLNRRGHEGSVEKLVHHEEMALQNSCSQECLLPSLQSEVQKQGTVCQSLSECSSGSPSSGQTSLCSDHQSPQSSLGQETE
jgi:hypothetical protein